MPGPAHLATPLRLVPTAGGTTLATNDEGSPAHADARIFATLNTPQGWLTHLPEFGRPGLTFRRVNVTPAEVERILGMWVPDVDLIAIREAGRLDELAEGRDVLTVQEERAE
jgi:hypothetical protein